MMREVKSCSLATSVESSSLSYNISLVVSAVRSKQLLLELLFNIFVQCSPSVKYRPSNGLQNSAGVSIVLFSLFLYPLFTFSLILNNHEFGMWLGWNSYVQY